MQKNCTGFAVEFAKEYLNDHPNKTVIIMPGGCANTGFEDKRWNKGDDLYTDAVNRTRYIMTKFPNSKLIVILWHQGERDILNTRYTSNLDSFIINIRNDLNNPMVPFILGGMVPYWVKKDSARIVHQTIISDTPNRIVNSGYADPELPFVIEKPDNDFDEYHYSSEGLKELGRRYYFEYSILARKTK